MTAPNMAEKVCLGTPSQSAHDPYSVVSSIRTSPTSKTTAVIRRSGDGVNSSSAQVGKCFPEQSSRRMPLIRKQGLEFLEAVDGLCITRFAQPKHRIRSPPTATVDVSLDQAHD